MKHFTKRIITGLAVLFTLLAVVAPTVFAAENSSLNYKGTSFNFTEKSSSAYWRYINMDIQSASDLPIPNMGETKDEYPLFTSSKNSGFYFPDGGDTKAWKAADKVWDDAVATGKTLQVRFRLDYYGYHKTGWTSWMSVTPSHNPSFSITADTYAASGKIIHDAWLTVTNNETGQTENVHGR
ncbi:MAG: hypothetical protein LBN08_02050 [Lactobacillales bacterium]|jgi:hypothetical protein|nr:hypothetical protein [Lactobacillales bacterium]